MAISVIFFLALRAFLSALAVQFDIKSMQPFVVVYCSSYIDYKSPGSEVVVRIYHRYEGMWAIASRGWYSAEGKVR
jgi:hypothetical protein